MPATAEAIVDVADRLFTAIEKSDMAAVDRMWSGDIAVWRVGARPDPASTDDKARALRVIAITELDDGFIRISGQTKVDRSQFDLSWNKFGVIGTTATAAAEAIFVRAPR
jgi:ketosteroid isomerase-like protein